jgi:glutaredoxin-related protein
VFISGEFVGGSDILMQMHQSGELKKAIAGLKGNK